MLLVLVMTVCAASCVGGVVIYLVMVATLVVMF